MQIHSWQKKVALQAFSSESTYKTIAENKPKHTSVGAFTRQKFSDDTA